jgi:hypothetical protein
MTRQASRGISAPPEVVFSTATDPDRRGAWLPAGLELGPVEQGADTLQVRLVADSADAGVLRVQQGASGGSSVDLSVPDTGDAPEDILQDLDREVSDNFNAG